MDPSTADAVGSGVVTGGWTYVIAVYLATWLTLLGYAASVALRTRTEARRNADAGVGETASPT